MQAQKEEISNNIADMRNVLRKMYIKERWKKLNDVIQKKEHTAYDLVDAIPREFSLEPPCGMHLDPMSMSPF